MRKNFLKRIASFALAATMSCAMFNANEGISSVIENMSITASAATYIASGTYSDVTWKIDSNGVLYIDTDGIKIPDFTAGSAPWYSYRNRIKKIAIPKNLREIGNYAFYNLYNATNVVSYSGTPSPTSSLYCYLPTTLKRIGKGAFDYCVSLKGTNDTDLMIGVYSSGLWYDLTIEETAFRYCYNLKKVWIQSEKGNSVTIGKRAFSMCSSITYLNFDVDKVTLDENAFYNCMYLSTVRIDIHAIINPTAFAGTDFSPYSQAVGTLTGDTYYYKKGNPEKLAALINKWRISKKVSPLKYVEVVGKASQIRAEELTIRYNLNHLRPDDRECYTALDDVGFDSSSVAAGENITQIGFDTPRFAIGSWETSTGHYKNMVNPQWQYIGCGYAYGLGVYGKHNWQTFFLSSRTPLRGYTIIAR